MRLPFLKIMAATLLLALPAGAQTVDEIIAKNVQAHGGMEKLKSIKTARISGRFSAGSFRAAFRQENKRPDKVREETIVQGQVGVEAYDGKSAWRVSPFGGRKDPILVSADDMKGLVEDADLDGPLVDYKEKGHKAELVGHDSVEGTDCYKIKLTLKDGNVHYYFLDADSFLELKIETQNLVRGTIEEGETYFGDYEEVNGMYFPFAYEGGEKGTPDRVKYSVDRIEINVPMEDARFTIPSMPAAKPEAKKAGGADLWLGAAGSASI